MAVGRDGGFLAKIFGIVGIEIHARSVVGIVGIAVVIAGITL